MAAGPIISEFMASNASGIVDEDGDKSDWIEIYNPTAAPVDMLGWGITDDVTKPSKWVFPAVTLPAGGRMIVWASDKRRSDPTKALHTNFKLGAEGEYLGLSKAGFDTFAYAPTFPAQQPDVSYGVLDSDPTARRYFSVPTPGAANTAGSVGVVAAPTFSAARGFYDAPFDVTLAATTGARIVYTTDGSAPTESHGTDYTGAIHVTGTTTLRATAFKTGFAPAPAETRTYLFIDQAIHQPASIPGVPNRTVDGVPVSPEMDPDIINDPAYSGLMRKAMTDIPTMSIVLDPADAWAANGAAGLIGDTAEPRVSVEVLNAGQPAKDAQADGTIETHSHLQAKQSLRLSFKPATGDSEFKSSFLQDAPQSGATAADAVDRLVLRSGYNRTWARGGNGAYATTYTEDQFLRDTQLALTGEGAHGTFVHLYINGVYWGLYNPVEWPEEHFTSRYFGGDDEDWASINHDGVNDGDRTRWDYLIGALKDKDMSVASNYQELGQYLDTTNFVDYLLAEFYAGTTDWPYNNFWAGNRNTPTPGPTKFFAWDGEYSWGSGLGSNASAWVHPSFHRTVGKNGSDEIPNLFNAAKANPEFLMLLADRTYRATSNGGALTDAAAQARWDALNGFIGDAIVGESARWGDAAHETPLNRNTDWANEVARKRALMSGNANRLIAALRAEGYYPSINPPTFAQRGDTLLPGSTVTLQNPNSSGAIWYTLDGSDPRLPGGGISPVALQYTGPITLNSTATLRTRVLANDGTTWSAGDSAAFTVSPLAGLRIVELMYKPAALGDGDPDRYEFLELQNAGATDLNLNGVKVAGGVDFTFGDVTIPAGGYVILAENASALPSRYGGALPIAGQYSGKLSDNGERIRLLEPGGAPLLDFTYSPAWYPATNGGGASLVFLDPLAHAPKWNDKGFWRPSTAPGGTPAAANPAPANTAPIVAVAGPATITLPGTATVSASITDDGLPLYGAPSIAWSKLSGPGDVTFANAASLSTGVSFSAPGDYVLRASSSDGELTGVGDLSITVKPYPGPVATRFVLVDAVTDRDLFVLEPGANGEALVNIGALVNPNALNIRVESNDATRSVRFGFDSVPGTFNANYKVETAAPRALFGDTNGDYKAGSLAVGLHTLVATPFAADGATGQAGAPLTLKLRVENTPVPRPPAAPASSKATVQSTTAVKLNWSDASNNETGFAVEIAVAPTSGAAPVFTHVTNLPAGSTSYIFDGLSPATTYYFRAVAFNAQFRAEGAAIAATTKAPSKPKGPSSLKLTLASPTAIDLVWKDNASDESGYTIERSTDGVTYGSPVTLPANTTTYRAAGLSQNTKYWFRATAYNLGGASPAAVAGPLQTPAPVVPGPVAAPTGLKANATSATSIVLTWTDASTNETGFNVFVSANGGAFTSAGSVGPNVKTFTATGLAPATQYAFYVRAFNDGFQSDPSATVSIATPTPPSANGPAITRLVLINSDSDQDVLTLVLGGTENVINRSSLPSLLNFNVRAEGAAGTVGVRFGYQGNATFADERGAPYALFGDSKGDYKGQTLRAGLYTITANAYDAAGVSGQTVTCVIRVI